MSLKMYDNIYLSLSWMSFTIIKDYYKDQGNKIVKKKK